MKMKLSQAIDAKMMEAREHLPTCEEANVPLSTVGWFQSVSMD